MSERLLFLKSSASNVESYEPFFEKTNTKANELTVCFVTTASKPARNKDFIQRDLNAFSELGFGSVSQYDISNKPADLLAEDFDWFDIVFLSGGNTFYLMKQIRNSGFETAMPKMLDEGVIYMSSSAGSIAAGSTTVTSNWKNPDRRPITRPKYTQGLGYVPFAITPHLDDGNRRTIEELAGTVDFPVAALTDEQSILVVNEEASIVGQGERHVFNNFPGKI